MRLLLELRPALDVHAGIPQAPRRLFRGLAGMPDLEVEGLLQSSSRLLSPGLPASEMALAKLSADRRVDRLSRTVVSLQGVQGGGRIAAAGRMLRLGLSTTAMAARTLMGMTHSMGRFEPA